MLTQEQIKAAITQRAEQYGLDPQTMLAIGHIESKFNPNAYNKSGASGVFQFMPGTAKGYGLDDPFDAEANIDAGMRLARDNIKYFRNKIGREPTPGEVYLMHQQGMGGATKLMSNPSSSAADIVGRQAVLQNGGNLNMTAAEFAGMWGNKLNSTIQKMGGTVAAAPPAGGMGIRPDGSIGQVAAPAKTAGGVGGPSNAGMGGMSNVPTQQPVSDQFQQRLQALVSASSANLVGPSPIGRSSSLTRAASQEPSSIRLAQTIQSGVAPVSYPR